jgi:hypothetical protein
MKRGIQKQLTLPFDADVVSSIFVLFEPEISKWHTFQDKAGCTGGNDYYWWSSRWNDWIQEQREQWSVEKYLNTYQLFPRIWERFEEKFTRIGARGVPNSALENL